MPAETGVNLIGFRNSPLLVRVVPFAIFLVLTFCQNYFGEAGRYWSYLAKTLAGAWLLWLMRPFVPEMRWRLSWEAIAVGIVVFILWVGLADFAAWLGLKPSLVELKSAPGKTWNPFATWGPESAAAWFFATVRLLGATLVVPPLEEVFFRSFLYRYLVQADFEKVPLGKFFPRPFLITSVLFGFEHREWLAGILCGFAYQGLVVRKGRLGDAMSAHALTNLLLGLWVLWKGAWQFW